VRWRLSPYGGRTRRILDQGHFAKTFSGPHQGIGDGFAFPFDIHVHSAGKNDKQTVTHIAFVKHHGSGVVGLFGHLLADQLQFGNVHTLEKLDLTQ
jgi:hypothetical protein